MLPIRRTRIVATLTGLAALVAMASVGAPRAAAAVVHSQVDGGGTDAGLAGPVLLIGDSMMRVGVGEELQRALWAAGIERVDLHARSSTGLARPDFFDWPKEAKSRLANGAYRTVVVMIGANDAQSLVTAKGKASFGSDRWRQEYGARVASFLDVLCASDRRVVWLGLPPMRQAGYEHRLNTVGRVVESTVAQRPCARFVATREAFNDKSTGKRVAASLRQADGVHISARGGQAVSKLLLRTVGAAR